MAWWLKRVFNLTVRVRITICEVGVRWRVTAGGHDSEVLPLADIAGRGVVVGGCFVCVASKLSDLGHGLNANDALQSQVGLVSKSGRAISSAHTTD